MRRLKILLLLVAIFTLQSCKKSNSDSGISEDLTGSVFGDYTDGTYCADVEYYNPETGTRNTYALNVEVENHEVTVIHWPNGGWLDSTHFSPETLDSNGNCSFTSYDGKQYDIQITGSECTFTDDAKVQNDEDAVSCPQCGGTKSEFDNECDDCKRKAEDKEEHTCKRCGQEDSFMFSTDDLCSDCKRADEDKQREEEEAERRREEEENNE